MRNRGRVLRARLRSPRYAFALLLGAGYLALVLFGQRGATAHPAAGAGLELGGSVLVGLLVAKWWLFGADRLALAFAPAEIQFLFPAPVSRAALLGYKLLRAQVLILFNVLIWLLLLHRGSAGSLPVPLYGLGLWAVFTTLFLHRLAAALTRDAITTHGRSGLGRNWPAVVVLVVGAGLILVSARAASLQWKGGLGAHPEGPLAALGVVLETAPLRWLLLPFRVPFLPLGAANATDWLPRFLAALAVVVLHVLWVVRADHAFEESAIEASARRAELLERWRRRGTGNQRPVGAARRWVRLGVAGHPVWAVVWKNTTRLIRTTSPALFGFIVLLSVGVVGYSLIGARGDEAINTVIATMALTWVGVLGILGPQWVRIDIRGDLDHLAALRTWPMSGSQLMTAQVLSAALVLTMVQAGLVLVGLVALVQTGTDQVTVPLLLALAVPGLAVLAALNLVAFGIQNGGALLYPSWVRTEIRPGGIEAMGQHLLTAGVSVLLLLLASLGPAVLGGGLIYLARPHLGAAALAPGLVAAAAGLGLEAFLLLDWLGTRFERLDMSAGD